MKGTGKGGNIILPFLPMMPFRNTRHPFLEGRLNEDVDFKELIEDVQKRFDENERRRQALLREVAELEAEQHRLQGEFRALQRLQADEGEKKSE